MIVTAQVSPDIHFKQNVSRMLDMPALSADAMRRHVVPTML